MDTRSSLIFKEFAPTGLLTAMEGEDVPLFNIAAIEDCGPGDLVFVDRAKAVEIIRDRRPSAVVTSPALQESLTALGGMTVLIASNIKLAHALLRQRYVDRDVLLSEWPDIHPSAVIHPSCEIEKGSRIGPNVVLGKGVRIGNETAIMAGSVVENGAKIGNQSVIHPNVTIGYDCEIGNEVIIQSGAVIGSEGYGFAQDESGHSHRIPQLGKVVIEDRVSIGAGCCIDRATYAETRIGAGTKLDNLSHIAHNVQIGQDCLLTAGFIVAGSTTIGDRVIASGQTGVLDHLEICNDVVLLHRAGVTKSIDKPGAYAGLPVQPLPEYMKNTALMKRLSELRKQVQQLEKRLPKE
ncbi:MAG: UDP-3-O-(3-hydroxymyristoyl)glucosamine N-acyltransferase [Sedimenticola thiotaurini]|uniref:UDP-3-O-acylglucosamine N-acyltransferase n=1 Tax=Sedimenticola thiotaurini TaxID=1543721 RepID=A0A558DG36_9GAMM|nr:MAG: UDP-3-O-(3-hydroxymyristoyl)glucosamine N-acyltransferase [Sedimenticola thiotaurini]